MNDMIKEAKLKALSLLNFMDRTESQLRQKLKEKQFDEEAIEEAIRYVKSFGYINDEGYAERYIASRQGTKSRREIYMALAQKGVSKECIDIAMENSCEQESEIIAIKRLCEKRRYDVLNATDAEKKKMYGYLMRKGFRNEDVCKVLKV